MTEQQRQFFIRLRDLCEQYGVETLGDVTTRLYVEGVCFSIRIGKREHDPKEAKVSISTQHTQNYYFTEANR